MTQQREVDRFSQKARCTVLLRLLLAIRTVTQHSSEPDKAALVGSLREDVARHLFEQGVSVDEDRRTMVRRLTNWRRTDSIVPGDP